MRMRLVSNILVLGVWLIFFASSSQAAEKTIQAVRTVTAPKIDGFIESTWAKADSVTEFVQTKPREGQPATERTVAYFLYDDQNLYVAFKCYDSEPEKLVVVVGPRGDASGEHISFFTDSFGDKVTAYDFCVNAAGVQDDFHVSGDGYFYDKGWEGVWYSAAKVTDFGYVVEFRIPFKSLRYKKGLSRWGIGFERWISRKEEKVCWPPQKSEEFRVSRLGQLVGIYPGEMGLHLELYPVALARYDKPSTSPDAGLDFSWHPTPSSSFHLTANPDFAQVEADPYQINLSKYETWLAERRPFFVEGSDLFGCMGGITPFYSRRIGKRLPGGKEVPVLAGSKFIARPGRFEIGVLSALTGEVEYREGDTTRIEPQSWYSAFRVKRSFLESSQLGFLYAGREGEGFNRVSVLDGILRVRDLKFRFAGAYTNKSTAQSDYGGKFKFAWITSNFAAGGMLQYMGEHFDVSQVGFYPWVGKKEFSLWGGPILHNKGFFKRMWLGFTGWWQKEFKELHPEYSISNHFDFNFVNNWGFHLSSETGKKYEEERWYSFWSAGFRMWSDESKPVAGGCGFRYNSQTYNYRRAYLAPNGYGDINLRWRVNPRLS